MIDELEMICGGCMMEQECAVGDFTIHVCPEQSQRQLPRDGPTKTSVGMRHAHASFLTEEWGTCLAATHELTLALRLLILARIHSWLVVGGGM